MALSVATNVGALHAAKSAQAVNASMETSMARLASGSRLNSAADDSAGVSIASRLTSEARGYDMAYRNAADAQSLIDTAESAMIEIENILQRFHELAVQGASDTASEADRDNIVLEMTALHAEITNMEEDTKWGGQTLIDAANTFVIQLGNEASETVEVKTDAMDVGTLGITVASNTQASMSSAITAATDAIKKVANARAKVGAESNRMDFAMQHFANTATEIKSSLGRIKDTDFAAESTNLAKTQILQQAATSMLAQANASKQSVLQLLQG